MALTARIYVTPRKDVLDPQGAAVGDALHALGFDDVADVRVGRYVELALSGDDPVEGEKQLRAMCEKLIANPVVEDFRFEITRVGDDA
jgi:phosphoribosylformylglycinamidine synthase PurS subunit